MVEGEDAAEVLMLAEELAEVVGKEVGAASLRDACRVARPLYLS